MRLDNRPFDEGRNDFQRLWDFLVDDYTDKQDRFIWTIGRLGDWKYGCWNERKNFPDFMRNNAHLWLNEFGQPLAFVISEGCDSNFTLFARRGHEFLYPEIIAWVKDNWGDRGGGLNTVVHEYQDGLMQWLAEAGFAKGEVSEVTHRFRVSDKAAEGIRLGEGLRFEDMATHPDPRGKALLGMNAWRGVDEVSDYDLKRYSYNRESPCFNPAFDLSVVDADGLHVAACVAFIDWRNNYAEIEKVCTHGAYRRKGLAEAVIRECFRRLHEHGVEYAYITGMGPEAISLYGKLGSVSSRNWYPFKLV